MNLHCEVCKKPIRIKFGHDDLMPHGGWCMCLTDGVKKAAMPHDLTDADRAAYEEWAKPLGWDVSRHPDDPAGPYVRHGEYRSHFVECNWDAWQAGLAAGRARAIEECAQRVENGRFLHDDAPTARFAKECAAAIRALK